MPSGSIPGSDESAGYLPADGEPSRPSQGSGHRDLIRAEFDRAAAGFAERTKGRFDDMDVVGFSQVQPHETVLEVGAGTGNFLSLFEGRAARRIALDLTPAMLAEARRRHAGLELVLGDAAALPLQPGFVDLVASAQALHHIHEPVPALLQMRRIAGPDGRILILDQHAPESYEKAAFMNQLEAIRDPSHAMSRPPSAFRVMVQAAGLEIVDEKLWSGKSRFSKWMWPGEFPAERIESTRDFIAKFGPETGMEWERDGNDWTFTRHRIMLLARRA
ncbi:MAG: class I SAM-dependent methyltransferase [Actinomycetota bacterium]